MNSSGVKPLKHLSQNFLVDPNISRKIVDSMRIDAADRIVEIGPGEGVLTELLLINAPQSVTAVEIDSRLISHLQTRFGQNPKFHLLHQDFLNIDFESLIPTGEQIRIVGNLPYGVTSPILFHILEQKSRVIDLTIMVQKEVGERLAAMSGSKEYGIPSVLFQAVSDIHLLFNVSRNAFRPVPEVESVILHITFHDRPLHTIEDWPFFRTLVKTAFNQRRKMLRNTLKQSLSGGEDFSIDLSRRPEQLSIDEWVSLYNDIQHSLNNP